MKIQINKKNLLDIVNLKFGSFNPLNSFMSEENINSVIESHHLTNNNFFPIPIFFDIDIQILNKFNSLDTLELYYNAIKVCDLSINSVFKLKSKNKLGSKLFKTNDKKHPGYLNFLKAKKYFIDGSINNFENKVLKFLNFSDPNNILSKIKSMKFKTVAGFHTRNAPHNAHEWIHNYALKKCDALIIHPLIGQFLKKEYKEETIIKLNKYLIKNIYNKKNIFLEFFNYYPLYAGPTEALFHALVRKNYGCTHFLVGRDHAGTKNKLGQNYYKKYESQEICKKYEAKLGIKIISFDEPYFCKECNKILNKCTHSEVKKIIINGSKIRKLIIAKNKIPEIFMRKKISKYLSVKSII